MAATADAGTAATADAGSADGHMANCPTAAPGATVALKDVEGGIEVVDHRQGRGGRQGDQGPHGEARRGRQERGRRGREARPRGQRPRHVRTLHDRHAQHEAHDRGHPERREGDRHRQRQGRGRLRCAARRASATRKREWPASDGAGIHKMAHCPSAVEGAKTVVKDSKEGVIVTVTAPPAPPTR